MQFPGYKRLAAFIALSFLVAGYDAARSTPLSEEITVKDSTQPWPVRRLSETEIVGTGFVRPESGLLSPSIAESAVQQYLDSASGESGNPWARDRGNGFQYGSGTGSPFEIFRSMVNVPKGSPRNAPARAGSVPDDGLLGADAKEWVDEAVRGIVNSAIELKVNDQGRTTFSVLGMGEFGVMMSGDRSEIALVAGDDVLLTAHRVPYPQSGPGAGQGFPDGNAPAAFTGAPSAGEASIQKALETVQEIATHPLSVLVYAVVGGFLVLWKLMSAQPSRPAAPASFRPQGTEPVSRRSSRRHRSRRSRRA